MNSYILQIASKYIRALLIVFSLIALIRGHNYPGGGFIGGLLAGLAILFNGFSYNFNTLYGQLKINPVAYIILGFTFIWISIFPSFFKGENLMQGNWVVLKIFDGAEFKIGTPFIFDIGVFFIVIGVTVLSLLTLSKNIAWK